MRKRYSVGYLILKPLVWGGSRLFYRRFVVRGLDHFPRGNQPTMLISNHQNGMMDPIMCCISTRRQLHFLTRADLFRHPTANKLLRALNMLPVYRAKDRVSDLVGMNKTSFNESYDRLLAGNVISAFPEGNHNNRKWLRPFRKGVARVAFGAMDKIDFEKELFIIPVGVDYSNYTEAREEIILNFGEPVTVKRYKEMFSEDPVVALSTLTRELQSALSKQVIDIRSKKQYDSLMFLAPWIKSIFAEKGNRASGFDSFKKFTLAADEAFAADPELAEKFDHMAKSLKMNLEKHGLDAHVLASKERKLSFFMSVMVFIVALPFSTIGLVLNFLPALIISEFVRRQVRDPHFKSSIKLAMGIPVFLIFWIFEGILLYWFSDIPFAILAVLIAAPICGIIAADSWTLLKKGLAVVKWKNWLKKGSNDAKASEALIIELSLMMKEISKNKKGV